MDIPHMLQQWQQSQQLIRLQAVKGRGVSLDIACKILSFNANEGMLSVYDVDRKQVELIRLNEIEDIRLA